MNGCSRSLVTSRPCAAPRQAPNASTAASATPAGQRHSTSIIDSNTPSSAQIDPTDKSMPPLMITTPTPMLKIPYVPTSRATFWTLATLRNCGLANATIAHSTTSSRRTPISFLVISACQLPTPNPLAPDQLPIRLCEVWELEIGSWELTSVSSHSKLHDRLGCACCP